MSTLFFEEEKKFLEGPRSRWKEFTYVITVMIQFIKGFRALHFLGPCITIFGSARFNEDNPYYNMARKVSAAIAELGFTIVTGGGGGIMEAANRGAKDVDGRSIGCNIILPQEQKPNIYLDKYVNINYFFVRKELLRKYSFAFIVMPGGFGTLDEFFETITLIQTKKMEHFPVVIMGIEYHKHLIDHINKMIASKTINEADLNMILFTDSIEDVVVHLSKYAVSNVKLKAINKRKPIWFIGEKPN